MVLEMRDGVRLLLSLADAEAVLNDGILHRAGVRIELAEQSGRKS
jgi:hypothetical protein